jgi:AraC family transcriptional regulator
MRSSSVVYIRAVGPYQQSAKSAWDQMRAWIALHNIPRPLPRGIGFIRDNPDRTGPFLRRYDACIDLTPGLDIDYHAGVGRQTLPGGTFAVYTHVGPHRELREAFQVMKHDALRDRGLSLDADRQFMEIYLDDPGVVPVGECRTELCVPILASAAMRSTDAIQHPLVGAA